MIALLTYIYVSSIALLFGIKLDACVPDRVREAGPDDDRGC